MIESANPMATYMIRNIGSEGSVTKVIDLTDEEAAAIDKIASILNENYDPYAPSLSITRIS